MGQYNFVNPGAAASEGILDILAKRREEARQKMLDEVANKDAEVRRRATEENITSSQQQRELQALGAAQEGLDFGQEVPEDSPQYGVLNKWGRLGLNPNPTPSVSTETDFGGGEAPTTEGPPQPETPPAPPKKNFFRGDRAQQDEERSRNDIGALIGTLQGPENKHIADMLATYNATRGKLPAGYWNAAQPRVPMSVFDVESGKGSPYMVGGKPVYAGPGDPSVLTQTRPPRQPQDPNRYSFAGVDAEGNPVTLDNMDGSFRVSKDIGKIGAKPSNGSAAQRGRSGLDASVLNSLTRYAGDAAKGTAAGGASHAQAQSAVISKYNTSQDVRDTITDILANEDASTSTFDIIKAHREFFPKPEEFEQFSDLLQLVRGS